MALLETVTPTVRYANAPTAIGIVTHGERALLVDSGLDDNLVRKVVNQLQTEGVTVVGIVNTHSHADHCGGNAWAVKRTGALVAAPAYEHFFIERPELEPYTLFGAPAPSTMRGKFLQAAPSRVGLVVETEGVHDVAGFEVRFRALGGHSVRQMGIEVDGVLFVGDALLPPAVAEKYGLLFAVDPFEARASAERLLTDTPAHVVAYHGGLLADVPAAVDEMRSRTLAAEQAVLEKLAKGPLAAEELLVDLLDRFAPSTSSIELHALQAATLRGYLSALERAGRVEAVLERHRLLWRVRTG